MSEEAKHKSLKPTINLKDLGPPEDTLIFLFPPYVMLSGRLGPMAL